MKTYNLTIVINDHIIHKRVRATHFRLSDNRYTFYGGEDSEEIVLVAPDNTVIEVLQEVIPMPSTIDAGNEANWSC